MLFKPKGQEIQAELTNGTQVKVNYASDQAQIQFQEALESKDIEFDSKGVGALPGGPSSPTSSRSSSSSASGSS